MKWRNRMKLCAWPKSLHDNLEAPFDSMETKTKNSFQRWIKSNHYCTFNLWSLSNSFSTRKFCVFTDAVIKGPEPHCLCFGDAILHSTLPSSFVGRSYSQNSHPMQQIWVILCCLFQQHRSRRSRTSGPTVAAAVFPLLVALYNNFLCIGRSQIPRRSKRRQRQRGLPSVIDPSICTSW